MQARNNEANIEINVPRNRTHSHVYNFITGFVEEDQFVGWVQKLPQDTLDSLLTFHIVPPEINRDAHRTFTAMRDSVSNSHLHIS